MEKMTAMTSRERVRAVLNAEKLDRVPFNFWMDRNLMAALDAKFGSDFRINHYGADVHETFIAYDWNCGLHARYETDGKTHWQTAPALDDMAKVRALKFPEIAGAEDAVYNMVAADRKRLPGAAIFVQIPSPLDCFFNLRIMENAMIDFYECEDECKHYIDAAGRRLAEIVRGLKGRDIDLLYLAGDICSSRGPMMSEAMLRRYCFDPMAEALEEARKLGLKTFYHTDGALKDILPLLVEYRFAGVNPLQPTINDSAAFKRQYGSDLMLYGGIDNCFAIPDSDPAGVRRHIRGQYEALGADGGLIFSSHDIPDYVPLENIDAMVDEIKKCGR